MGHPADIRYRGGWRNGKHVGITHAILTDALSQSIPVETLLHVDVEKLFSSGLLQQLQRIDRQNALIPEGPLKGFVAATFFSQFSRSANRVIADHLHGYVGECHGLLRGIGNALRVQGVLEAHDSHADRSVLQV